MSKKITKDEVQKQLNTMPLSDLLPMLEEYSKTHAVDLKAAKQRLITDDLQNRLMLNGINTECPKCGSKEIAKNGIRNSGIQEFKCKACNKKFSLFSGTIIEKTQYHWEIWVKVVELVLQNTPVEHILQILIEDYGLKELNYKSVFLWKHKIIHALAQIPMPVLSGIIQVDETFFREDQKGSRNLVSTVKGEARYPRYGRQPSKYGVMGNEFANVVCMTDLKGYCVAKVIGLGKLDVSVFTDLFDEHIDNPSYLCSDGNTVYKHYCEVKSIPLYVKPSNYLDTIQKHGYIKPDWNNPKTAEKQEKENFKILSKLYEEHLIDYIYNRNDLDYKTFSELKNANSLSLARVNQFHSELKRFLVYNSRGVSTKYLQDYIGFQTFLRNWRITHGHHPSSLKDAQDIFVDILKGKTTYTTSDMDNSKLDLPKASDRYMALLKQKTNEMRRATSNPYFKYDEEDNVISFNKREYLEDLPKYKLDTLRKHYKIKRGWSKYSIISELLKKADIDEQIMLMINEDKHIKISEEDLAFIKASAYKT